MKGLSVRQPWAWAIFAGKDVENRSWGKSYPALHAARRMALSGELIAIHAGKGMTRDEYWDAFSFMHPSAGKDMLPEGVRMPHMDDLPRGGIVGVARLSAVVTESASRWFFGPIGLVLTDTKPVPFEPLSGSLGFFDIPAAITSAVLAAADV